VWNDFSVGKFDTDLNQIAFSSAPNSSLVTKNDLFCEEESESASFDTVGKPNAAVEAFGTINSFTCAIFDYQLR